MYREDSCWYRLCALFAMGFPLQPQHAERSHVKQKWDEASEKDDPSSGEAKRLAVEQRKEPCQEVFAGGETAPIVGSKCLTGELIDPDLALPTNFRTSPGWCTTT